MSVTNTNVATKNAAINKAAISKASIIDFRVRVPPGIYPEVKTPEENSAQYNAVLNIDKTLTDQSLQDLLSEMEANGVDHAVMHAEYEHHEISDQLNRIVADSVQQHPDRLSGIGTLAMADFSIKKALYQIDQCVEMGMIGLSIQPAFFGMTIDQKQLYPIYGKAMESNLLVALHTGVNYTTNRPMAGENPMLLDTIACDFPDLTIIASHAGWPWIAEMVAVARKHPNVLMEFGGLAPKYIGAAGSGWEMMYRFMNSVLKDQILYGTDWPVMSHERTLDEWRGLSLKPEVLEGLLGGNARRLLG